MLIPALARALATNPMMVSYCAMVRINPGE
jgi:hypothetical protein